ncbi:MAG: tRNA uridine-5-carboxymethylaminomethyl(34) synthesis GTPase MnmE [Sedimentisphaerales bacterium]|jgi:tRNA modification GTPase
MYASNDTIIAVSSPANDHRVIVRISGPQTFEILGHICTSPVADKAGITTCRISDINLDAVVYLFRSPHSYTGDDLAEIHLWANQAITGALMEKLLSLGARTASAGEFTARAYLNNKIDLAQAEAVNEVITASNTFQLAAAENLLAGRLGRLSKTIRESILDILSRLEANLDFSAEDITPANKADIIARLSETKSRLKDLLAGSIRSESTIDLPAVGIAGSPNAGKSTLLNKLLGRQRSIVSHHRKTTRDVLTGELELPGCRCILFDCAGLLAPSNVEGIVKSENILDELAQQAAIEAIKNAAVVTFCVDISKDNWVEDLAVFQLIQPKTLISIATKTDLLSEKDTAERLSKLKSLFGCDFLPVSVHNNAGIDKLKTEITNRLTQYPVRSTQDVLALTTRHRQALNNAIHDTVQAEKEIKAGSEELAAMMLRTAYNQLSGIEQHNIDEQVLDRIFSRFCIGK